MRETQTLNIGDPVQIISRNGLLKKTFCIDPSLPKRRQFKDVEYEFLLPEMWKYSGKLGRVRSHSQYHKTYKVCGWYWPITCLKKIK